MNRGFTFRLQLKVFEFDLAPTGRFSRERAQAAKPCWEYRLQPLQSGAIVGSSLIAVVALAKLFINVLAHGPGNWMDKALPLVSMAGICLIIAIITARSREKLIWRWRKGTTEIQLRC